MIADTREGLVAAGYKYESTANCRGCGVPIEWWTTPRGKKMPMSVKVKNARVPHWAECPAADSFRRKP
jgi:hypothetical protein